MRSSGTSQRGVAALEFALVGPLLLVMMLSMVEVGLLCIRMTLLSEATAMASRSVYLGEARDGAVDQDDLEAEICRVLGAFASRCEDNLTIEVAPVARLSAGADGAPTCHDSRFPDVRPKVRYAPGRASEIMMVRVCLTASASFPMFGVARSIPKTPEGRFKIVATSAFINEPF